ncbi:MAG: molybdopterin-dependent oxidoreductase [Chthoniobacteraceae bacterium]
MSTETPTKPAVEMLNVQIDGVWMQFPKGTRAIEACRQAGSEVPHYCYHPKLSSPGNCRMCLIETGAPKMTPDRQPVLDATGKPELNWSPRPMISCALDVSEGMGIRTHSKLVEDCRKGVMEFLLINHPLDCPICDQAGECKLQEYSVDHGHGQSRFLEHKVKKPKHVEIGPRVMLDAERCILCTRCIRFMKEVAKDDVIGIVERGTFNTIACHPDRALDSNYSLNTVDICPVGALTSTDFRFKMRVWFLKETKSIDVNCGTGSNILIGSRENVVYRITPRENEDVNSCWLPDSHRLNFKYLSSDARLKTPEIRVQGKLSPTTWATAIQTAAEGLRKLSGNQIAVIASGRMTNEEMFLARRLAKTLNTTALEIVPRTGEADGILISADRNPNTTGAQLLGLTGPTPGAKLKEIANGVTSGAIKGLVLLGEDALNAGFAESTLSNLEVLVSMDILPSGSMPHSTVILPSSAFAEKRGSMINLQGRLQRLNQAVTPPGHARDDWEILRDLIQALSGGNGLYMIEDVFKQMAAETPALTGLSLSKIGDLGKLLTLTPAATV